MSFQHGIHSVSKHLELVQIQLNCQNLINFKIKIATIWGRCWKNQQLNAFMLLSVFVWTNNFHSFFDNFSIYSSTLVYFACILLANFLPKDTKKYYLLLCWRYQITAWQVKVNIPPNKILVLHVIDAQRISSKTRPGFFQLSVSANCIRSIR